MSNLLSRLCEPLKAHEIDFRVQSINKGGYATILAYKDARVDINRLNSVCGLGWKREHTNGNHNCIVSIFCPDIKEWVSREDTGTESFTEAAKGLASDSFKRACFNFGIGIELYDYPVIQIKLNQNEFTVTNNKAKQTWDLKLRDWVWRVDHVGSEVTYIAAKDQNGDVRYSWGSAAKKAVVQNLDSVTAVQKALSSDEIGVAAEAWFEIPCWARRNMYVSEKHGGPFTPTERKLMQDEFINHYHGEEWTGLFSE